MGVEKSFKNARRSGKLFQFPCSSYLSQLIYASPSVAVGQFVAAHHLWDLLVEEWMYPPFPDEGSVINFQRWRASERFPGPNSHPSLSAVCCWDMVW